LRFELRALHGLAWLCVAWVVGVINAPP